MNRRAIPWLLVAGLLVVSLSIRSPITSVPPVASFIMNDFGVSAAAMGLLTTAPVFMFALCTPLAPLVIRRAGPELALLGTLAGVLVGTLLRLGPSYGWMLAGMIVIGVSLTVGNVVIPVIIRRDIPPEYAATATAAYTAAINVGSLATTLGTAPLAQLIGWSPALAAWLIFVVAGIVVWLVHMSRRDAAAEARARARVIRTGTIEETRAAAALTGPMPIVREVTFRQVISRPMLWLLLIAFASQSAAYYALTAWLPTMLVDTTGVTLSGAGALASLFQGIAIVGPFVAPLLLRVTSPVTTALAIAGCWIAMVLGMLNAPELFWVWATFGAVAHSGGFVVIFTAVVHAARSDAEAATMSAVIQGGGYILATWGAPLMGALYESSEGWTVPLTALFAVTVVYAITLVSAMFFVRR